MDTTVIRTKAATSRLEHPVSRTPVVAMPSVKSAGITKHYASVTQAPPATHLVQTVVTDQSVCPMTSVH